MRLNCKQCSFLWVVAGSRAADEQLWNRAGTPLNVRQHIRGPLKSLNLNGNFSRGTLTVNGNELARAVSVDRDERRRIRIPDGNLAERDGGGVRFSLIKPRQGENNMSIDATLDRFNARSLLALSPLGNNAQLTSDTQSDISGQVKVTGIPDAMNGSADLRFSPGRLAGKRSKV